MMSCSIQQWDLFFLTLSFITVPTLESPSVKVEFNQTATLPCNYKCSGLVKWTMFHNPDYILAQCNQTACRSEKGYGISHGQYLKGKLHLNITAVDYSKRALYTCDCNDVEACDVRLIIDTIASSVLLNPGEALVMDLPVAEPVEVIYKPSESAGLYGEQICTVAEHSIWCKAEYTPRTSLSHTHITLREVNVSDSGSYTIRDTENNEDIHIYTLTVKVVQPESVRNPVNVLVLGVVVGILLLILLIVVAGFVAKNRRVKRLKQEKAELEDTIQLNESELQEARSRWRSNSDANVFLRLMLEVDNLIQKYKTVTTSHSCPTLNNITVVEMLTKKKAEIDKILQGKEQDKVGQWWSVKRPELNTVIERWKMCEAE